MDIENLLQLYQQGALKTKILSGGTCSTVVLLEQGDQRFVYKSNDQEVLRAEAEFLTFYQNSNWFPRLIHSDPDFKFLILSFMQGDAGRNRGEKKKWLPILVNKIINHYQVSPATVWGYLDSPCASWPDFLTDSCASARKVIGSKLSDQDHELVADLASRAISAEGYVIHGDFGVHNFMFEDGELVGVITT